MDQIATFTPIRRRSMNRIKLVAMVAGLVSLGTWALAGSPAPTTRPTGATPGLTPPLRWVSTGPLVKAKSDATRDLVAIKDPTIVRYNDRWHLFATTATSKGHWGMAYLNFADWKDAAKAPLYHLDENPNLRGYHCAPQVFYFRPQKKWYMVYQSQHPQFSTTTDIAKPESWSKPTDFFEGKPKSVVGGWLDYWVICDDTHAYLFFTDDDGRFYRSRTTLAEFPKGFEEPVIARRDDKFAFFEASCTYRIKGTHQYLTIVEALGQFGRRYFRAFIADSLDGQWRPLADTWENPFAALSNVRFADGAEWTDSISHGEILRDGYDQTMTIDPANLVFLYQGIDLAQAKGKKLAYAQMPWHLGLLHPDRQPPNR
jgi:hypothetical protein